MQWLNYSVKALNFVIYFRNFHKETFFFFAKIKWQISQTEIMNWNRLDGHSNWDFHEFEELFTFDKMHVWKKKKKFQNKKTL